MKVYVVHDYSRNSEASRAYTTLEKAEKAIAAATGRLPCCEITELELDGGDEMMTRAHVEWSESVDNTLVYKKHHGYVDGYVFCGGQHLFAMVIEDKEIKMIPYVRLTVLGAVA